MESIKVEKIDNGYLVSTEGMGKEEKKFAEDFFTVPMIIARMLGISYKNAQQIKGGISIKSDAKPLIKINSEGKAVRMGQGTGAKQTPAGA